MLLLEIYFTLLVIGLIITYPFIIILAIYKKLIKFIQNKQTNKSIKGQVAVVTGSARGFGRILAIQLAKRGCHVAIVDIQQDLAEETAFYISKNFHVKAKAYKVDVSNYQQLEELNKNVSRDLGDITILINNAAILLHPSIESPSAEDIQRMINVNLTSICFAHKIFLPKMKALKCGHIVNISSCAALFTGPYHHIYAATKAAVRSITSALRMELLNESKNITATTVMPVYMNTNEQVINLFTMSGITKILPPIDGTSAVEWVLESMLNGADEFTIPTSFIYFYKLFELLPVSIKEYAVGSFVLKGHNRMLAANKS